MYRGVDRLSRGLDSGVVADIQHIKDLRAERAAKAADLDALDAEIAALIKAAFTEYSATELAEELGISRARIYQIIKNG